MRHTRTRAVRLAAAALAVGVSLALLAAPAGAGGNGGKAKKSKKPPVELEGEVNDEGIAKVRRGSVTIDAGNFFFDGTFLKARTDSVEITIENGSSAQHTFTIDDQDIDEVLGPDDSTTVTVQVEPGEPVPFYCRFHRSSGMQGAVFRKAKAAASTTTSTPSSPTTSPGGSGSRSGSGMSGTYGY